MSKKFTDAEKQFVIENYSSMSKKEIADKLNRTENSIKNIGGKLGVNGKPNKPISDDELLFIVNNHKNMTSKEIAYKLNRTESSIKSISSKLNLKKIDCDWNEYQLSFLIDNYKTMTTKEISIALGKNHRTITNKARNLGLKKFIPYNIDKTFFELIDTEEKAYWLGFIYADGCVQQLKGKSKLSIGLASIDKDHLYKLRKSLKSETPIAKNKNGSFRLEINCTKLANDLVLLGCVPRKTYQELSIPKQIPHELIKHFIRGFIDGDGWLSIYNTKNKRFIIGVVSLYSNILVEIENHFNNLKIPKKTPLHCNPNNYKLQYSAKKDVLAIVNYLYKDATIYLDRKYEIANMMINNVALHSTSTEDVSE